MNIEIGKIFLIAVLLCISIVNSAVITGLVTEQMTDGSIGDSIQGAQITAFLELSENETEEIATAVSGEDGEFSLNIKEKYGKYLITSQKEGYFDGGVGGMEIDADYRLLNGDLTMSLIKWSTIYGTIKCGGEPAQGAVISAESDYKNFSTTTNAQGEYELELPGNVPFLLKFEKENCVSSSITNVYAADIDFSMDLSKVVEKSKPPEIIPVVLDTKETVQAESDNTLLIIGGVIVVIILIAVFWFIKKRK
ncbi:MAG: carboxypeptidase regulatory-like domain-containing protein [Candidatus Micrarchaeia archaeon]|jgi:LPXTG-motif cell wall-anchored protein